MTGPSVPAAGVALLLPGQGAQYPGMGTGLYLGVPTFATLLDRVFETMGDAGAALRRDWLSPRPAIALDDTRRSQPLLFAIDYALGRMLMDLGLRPAVLLGHSIGELAGATLAGVFDLAAACRIVLDRVDHLAFAPRGGMAAVSAGAAEIEPYLAAGIDIAAINAPRQTVIAGASAPLRATLNGLHDAGFSWATVPTHTPFRSRLLESVVEATVPALAGIRARPPDIPLVSGYTAGLLSAAQATDPRYWARHPVDPVLFWPALQVLADRGPRILVECGPGRGLTTTARRLPAVRSGRCVALPLLGTSAPDPGREVEAFRQAAAALDLAVA